MRRSAIVCVVGLGLVTGCKSSGKRDQPETAPPAAVATGDPVARRPSPSSSLPTSQPSTQPAATYSAERFRLVNQKDEVVSVLENGLAVVAKRVASPAVS